MKSWFAPLLTLLCGLALGLLFNFGLFDGDGALAAPSASLPPATEALPLFSLPLEPSLPTPTPVPTPAPDLEGNTLLLTRALAVTQALKDGDYQALSQAAHPELGVTFTPYSAVDPQMDLTFSAGQLAQAAEDQTLYVWGAYDGRGNPIQLTMADYFSRFVFNADYTAAPYLAVDEVLAAGNALENVAEAYPDARFVEFHFPGLDESQEGFDWCSLKLVFQVWEGDYKLVGVIHSEWTI